MDEKRMSRLSHASEWPRDGAQIAMQKVADTMIAVTESFRHHLRNQFGHTPDSLERRPALLARASSSSSIDSHKGAVVSFTVTGSESSPEGTFTPRPDCPLPRPLRLSQRDCDSPRWQGIPNLPELPGSTPLGLYRMSTRVASEDITIGFKLSSPVLPPCLEMPTTPTDWSAPPRLPTLESPPSSPICEPPSSADLGLNGLERHPVPRGYEYTTITIEPDCASEPEQVGTTIYTAMSKESYRRPVPVRAKLWHAGNLAGTKSLVAVVVCVAYALSAATFSQTLLVGGTIGECLSGDNPGDVSWFSAAYTLGAGICSLPAGRMAQVFGQKKVFVYGLLWLAVWSLLAALSDHVENGRGSGTAYFCFCRVMQGIATALLVPSGHVILRQAYPPGAKGDVVISLLGASAPVGFMLGAVMAGLFADVTSWQGSIYFLSIVSAILAALSFLIIPSTTTQSLGAGEGSLWVRLDGPGIALSVSGLIFLNVGWNQVPIVSWSAPYTYFLMVIGAILLAAFLYLETRAAFPLLPTRVLNVTASMVLGLVAASWASFGIWIFYLVQFLERVRGLSALWSSAACVPLAVSGVTASFAASYVLEERSRARWLLFVSAATLVLGSIFMATAPEVQTYWLNSFFSVIVVSLGIVMTNPAAMVIVGENKPGDVDEGMPTSLTFAVSMYAMSTALGMAGAVVKKAHGGEGDVLLGYRGAQYFGLGLAGLALVIASALVFMSYVSRPRKDEEMGVRVR